MKKIKSIIIGATFLFCVVAIQAQEAQKVCDSVLQYGARNIVSNMTTEQQKSYVFQKACRNKYKNSDSKTRLGIDVVIKSVPIGLDYGQDNAQTKIDQWCNDNQKYETNDLQVVNYENTVFQPSISAWESCVNASKAKIQVETEFRTDEVITFNVTNLTSDENVYLQGVKANDVSGNNSISCDVHKNDTTVKADENTKERLSPQRPVNVVCTRKTIKETRDNQVIDVTPYGSITLITTLKNFQLNLFEKSRIQLTDFRANRIEQRLDELQKDSFVGNAENGCMRNRNIQICWGKATISSGSAAWTRRFSANFPKEFAEPPTVTHAVHNNTSGHALVVYNWDVSSKGFTGALNNMYIAGAFSGRVEMEYMAIGKVKD